MDFLGGAGGNEPSCQWRRHGFNPWARKLLWRRAWQPTPVLLSGESLGQRSLVGYRPRGRKELDTTEETAHTQARTCRTTRGLYSMLCSGLYGKGVLEEKSGCGYVVADSLCCTLEANTAL